METHSYLAEEKLGKLMRKYAIPCIISLLVGALYNIVDQIFIANADYLGSYGNAANTVVFDDRRRLLCVRQYFTGREKQSQRVEERRQFNHAVCGQQYCPHGDLSDLFRADPVGVRRQGQRGDLPSVQGILLLRESQPSRRT